jgi:broad specificity phosphatase PhoE
MEAYFAMAGSLIDQADGSSLVDYTGPRAPEIYIMRHGRTALDVQHRSDGWLDLPLSDNGQLELIESQQLLKTVPITKIYTPDLKRTTETADLLKSGILSDPKIVVDDDAKTWNLGVLAGTPKKESRPKVRALMSNQSAKPPGGESYKDFLARFVPWFDKRAAEVAKTGAPILIVCSGSNLRCLGGRLLGDEEAVDLDEGGLACLRQSSYGWTGEVLLGGEDDGDYESA